MKQSKNERRKKFIKRLSKKTNEEKLEEGMKKKTKV